MRKKKKITMRPSACICNICNIWIESCKSYSFWHEICIQYLCMFCWIFNTKFQHCCWVLPITVSNTVSLLAYFRFGFFFAKYTIKVNILVHFLVLDTSWKSLICKFSKRVDNQQALMKEKDEVNCYFLDFLSQLRHTLLVTFLAISY